MLYTAFAICGPLGSLWTSWMMNLPPWRLFELSFVSSLLLKDDLDKMTVQNVFVCEDNQRRRRQDDSPAVGSALIAAPCICTFCGYSGHSQDACRQYARAKDQLLKNRNTRGKNKSNNNPSSQDSASVSQVTEFAGNASALSTSSSPTPLNTNWLADTGATSHMTPHRHWVWNYSPLRMPIRLADNSGF